jgi:hypothetical protein
VRAIGFTRAAVYEHQVDVRAVVQLATAQLTERDHREAACPSAGQARLTVARDELLADTTVAQIQDGVGQIR